MHRCANVFPIVGGRKAEHLKGTIDALGIKLTPKDVEEIELATSFDVSFPLNLLFEGQKTPSLKGSNVVMTKLSAYIDTVDRPKPIEPREKVGGQ